MKRHLPLYLTIICLLATHWAFAGDPENKLVQVAGNHQKNAAEPRDARETPVSVPEAPTMLTEIRAVMDSTRIAELDLRQEFAAADHPELTRRLGDLKRSTRMRILHIQLKYAREEGRLELERRILASIEDLQRPTAPGGPRLTGGISPPSAGAPVVEPAGGSQDR